MSNLELDSVFWLAAAQVVLLLLSSTTLWLVARQYWAGRARLTASVHLVGGRRQWTRELSVTICNPGGKDIYPKAIRIATLRPRDRFPVRASTLSRLIEAGNRGEARFDVTELARTMRARGYSGKTDAVVLLIDQNDRAYRLCPLVVDVDGWSA